VLLLDEPLSALDLKLRQHMRTELRAIQQQVGITFIYITHDQGEALTMSDSVAVMKAGVIDQIADGKAIYDDPSTAFVASFVGENNVFRGKVKSVSKGYAVIDTNRTGRLRARISSANVDKMQPGNNAMVFIRPEALHISEQKAKTDTRITAKVSHSEFEGQTYNVFLEGSEGKEMKMSLVNRGEARLYDHGENLTLKYDASQAVALPAGELAAE
jgi:spermidine/putrescine transport system ATP-binding protein